MKECFPRCLQGSNLHRRKLRVWQALAVLSAFCPQSEIESAAEVIWAWLQTTNHASVRQYPEAILVRLTSRAPHLVSSVLLPQLTNYQKR